MRVNLLREQFFSDDMSIGVAIDLDDVSVVEMMGIIGFRWVYLDVEHTGLSVARCLDMVRAADAAGMGSLIRVASAQTRDVLPFLETGVNGVMLPHVTTPEVATTFVRELRYPPEGTRGLWPGSRAAQYGLTTDPVSYYRDPSSVPVSVALLEDELAFERIDELVAVDGLDVFDFGRGDLSGSLGIPGRTADPRIAAYCERAARVIRGAGKRLCLSTPTPSALMQAREWGASAAFCSARTLLLDGVGSYRAAIGL
jgi:4-hydroxy-2-oxoheptanedioate aldolase